MTTASEGIKVKICGIRTLEDALVAAEAGADFIGIVQVPARRRRITADAAKTIVDGLREDLRNSGGSVPWIVGLFADQLLDEVNSLVEYLGLDLVQLCGKEPVRYATRVNCDIIKVIHVSDAATVDNDGGAGIRSAAYREAGHLVTLDRLVEGIQGGTGQRFDWEVAAALSQAGQPFLLAGGLNPDNVSEAIAAVNPWGVDVSSGVETEGNKDPEKIRAFVRNARAAAAKTA